MMNEMNAGQLNMDQLRAQLKQLVQQNPQMQQAINEGLQELKNDPDMTPEIIQQTINLLEQVMVNPTQYPQMRQMLLQMGVNELPEQFDPIMIGVFLMVLYQASGKAFARGGLAQAAERVRNEGRGADTILAHISPFEASVLRQYGGSGRINPVTGLPEYGFWKSVTKVFKKVAPIALAVFAPGLGSAIGSSILGAGASSLAAGALGGAVLGGGMAALTGGDILKGALFGGLGGGAGNWLGGAANNAMSLGLGQTGQAILGQTLAGAGIGAITGEGAAKGAMQGLAGGVLGNTVSGLAGTGTGAVAQGIRTAGSTMGNITTMGGTPQQVLTGGALAGLAQGVKAGFTTPSTAAETDAEYKARTDVGDANTKLYEANENFDKVFAETGKILSDPNATADQKVLASSQRAAAIHNRDMAMAGLSGPVPEGTYVGSGIDQTSADNYAKGTLNQIAGTPATQAPAGAGTTTPSNGLAGTDIGLNMKTLGAGMALMSLIGAAQTPEQVQQAVAGSNMSEAQKEYFNRNIQYWDWNELQNRAKAQNVGLGEYLSKNWNTVADETMYKGDTSGEVTKCMGGRVKKMAVGGPLSRLARGGGSGRDDTIAARLSDGEYVIDAETVALLGDGSIDEGARRLDAFRSNIRKQKGKALARGRISPNAKSPLIYLKGAM